MNLLPGAHYCEYEMMHISVFEKKKLNNYADSIMQHCTKYGHLGFVHP